MKLAVFIPVILLALPLSGCETPDLSNLAKDVDEQQKREECFETYKFPCRGEDPFKDEKF